MTILLALGLIVAFFFLPIEVICAMVGTVVAGLPGAIVGVIIGAFIDIASA
jgi:hypothetical protein